MTCLGDSENDPVEKSPPYKKTKMSTSISASTGIPLGGQCEGEVKKVKTKIEFADDENMDIKVLSDITNLKRPKVNRNVKMQKVQKDTC